MKRLLPLVGTGTATSAHYHSGQLLQTPCATKHGSEQISLRIPRFCITQIEQQFYVKTVSLRKDMRTEC